MHIKNEFYYTQKGIIKQILSLLYSKGYKYKN